MVQFIKFCSLASAGALLMAATPVLAGHVAGHGFAGHGVRIVRPGAGVAPSAGLAVVARPGMVAGPGSRPGFYPGGYYRPRPSFYGAYGRFGYDYGYAYPRPYYGRNYGGSGFLPGADVSLALPGPAVDVPGYPPYPRGYDDASYAPTGYGVSYNVPPPGWAPAKIIYLKGNHVRRETYFRPRQTVIVRGAASVD